MKFYYFILGVLCIALPTLAVNAIAANLLLEKTVSTPCKFQEKIPLKKNDDKNQHKVPDVVIQAQLERYFGLKSIDLKRAKLLLQVILKEDPNQHMAQAEMDYLLLAEKSSHKALIKSKRPIQTQCLLAQWLMKHPQDIHAQKEMGYLLLAKKQPAAALSHFKTVAWLSPQDYPIKLQIAYLLDSLNRKREAYHYFDNVTHSDDKTLRLKANEAMTNLAGTQTQFFNKPWFADIYVSPFYLSRFQLLVYPVQARLGRTYGCHHEWEVYGSVRAVNDNKSRPGNTTMGQLPQIYQDAFVLPALGFRYRPFYNKFPNVNLYAEVGKAYDLVLQTPNDPLWRNDFRGGLFFSSYWGAKPHYADTLCFPFSQVGNVYTDISYYSRYANLIGYLNVNEGVRLLEYHTASLDGYASLRSVADAQQQFYNNLVEIGPGIVFTPNHRYGFRLRAEFLKGYYIPVNTPSPNPYGPNYYNTLVIAEFYVNL